MLPFKQKLKDLFLLPGTLFPLLLSPFLFLQSISTHPMLQVYLSPRSLPYPLHHPQAELDVSLCVSMAFCTFTTIIFNISLVIIYFLLVYFSLNYLSFAGYLQLSFIPRPSWNSQSHVGLKAVEKEQGQNNTIALKAQAQMQNMSFLLKFHWPKKVV